MRPTPVRAIGGSSRPHLQIAKLPWKPPSLRRPGGPAALGLDLAVLDRAVCGADPDLFFEESAASVALAKKMCERCPVIAACLQQALENGEQYGVFGGLTARERRDLQRGEEEAA
ncbi:WhiB family transcriptional regulator [Streptomyces sp. UNOB3_S3]|uniref:WhiB family transcriptional regulator n=1 Tax=Streptomyces sp. UNOB3_S3 TaxID=2871682 RepID=UPI0027E3030D|nr:WhiB family transcriptional regulator [Streptomyces sp. UNOB3_S3]